MIGWFGLAFGVVGLALAAVAIAQMRAARATATASATAAQAAAQASEESAAQARRAADSAERLAAATAVTARAEAERRHDQLRPDPPETLDAQVEPDPVRGEGHAALYASITVPRDYRVYAEAVTAQSRCPLDLPVLLRAHRTERFEIEKWAPDGGEPQVREVRFLFWPPDDIDDIDDVEVWSCPCERAAVYGDLDDGHWEWRIPISY